MAGNAQNIVQLITRVKNLPGFQAYGFVDYATQIYLGFVAVLMLFFHGQVLPIWPWLVATHLVCMILIHAVIQLHAQGRGGQWIAFCRQLYPVMLYTGFYRETGLLNRMFSAEYVDAFVIRIDQAMFGFQPSLVLMDRWHPLWLSELFYIAYFSYYIMIAGVGIALFLRNRDHCYHYVAVVSFVFYICYLAYIFLPVVGPRLFFREINGYRLPPELLGLVAVPEFPENVTHGLFFQIMKVLYHHFEAEGAAFPSSHVAIAICTLYFSRLYLPRIRYIHAVGVVLLCIATVYCRYHYVIDVITGALTAAVLIPIGNCLYRRFQARLSPPKTSGPAGL